MEVLIVTQQEKWQFATCKKRSSDRIYVLTATNKIVNLVETRTVHFMTIKVARYSFLGWIPPTFERKLCRHKQRFGKINTTVVLDKDETLL